MKTIPTSSLLFSSLLFISSLHAQVPPDTEYNAPASGTLVFEEFYGNGSGRDGSGSLDVDQLLSTQSEYISFQLDAPTNTTLDLTSILDINTQSYVIDVGINGWSTPNTGSEFSLQFLVGSNPGATYNYIAWHNPTDELYGKDNASSSLAFPQDTQTVLRMTGTAVNSGSPTNAALLGLSTDSTTSSIGGAASAGEILVFTSGSGGAQSTLELSWLRIYTGVTDTSAPLTAIPEPATIGYAGGALLLFLGIFVKRLRRK